MLNGFPFYLQAEVRGDEEEGKYGMSPTYWAVLKIPFRTPETAQDFVDGLVVKEEEDERWKGGAMKDANLAYLENLHQYLENLSQDLDAVAYNLRCLNEDLEWMIRNLKLESQPQDN